MKFRYFFLCCVVFAAFYSPVSAATDDFTIQLQMGSDTTPPSTPSALTATPIATTQINLSWSASTDDILLEGYQVFRDAVQIATTTLTSYSDSGLTADTLYTYYVTAFDSAFNFSSSSNSVATSTLALTATSTATTTSNSGSGSRVDIALTAFTITPSIHSVKIEWKTNTYAQFELRWGRTSSFELGFVMNELFKREHTTSITELEAGTTYEYELVSFDRDGKRSVLSTGQFTTLHAPDETPPANVSNLKVALQGKNALLTWDNPSDTDFSYVRIVRNHLFYPTDQYDGFVAYQGNAESFYDREPLLENKIQYYTVFSYDKKGNISSGAVVIARLSQDASEAVADTSSTVRLQSSDIELIQEGVLIDSQAVDADIPLTFRIAYQKLPEHLKTITITLTHPLDTKTEFSFLLKINKDKTYYEATIAPLNLVGLYPVTVAVFDYQLKQLYTAYKPIFVSRSDTREVVFGIPLTTKQQGFLSEIIIPLWFLLLLLVLYVLSRVIYGISLKNKTLTTLVRTRLTIAILLCVGFGGITAYILTQLGSIHPASDTTIATVFQSGLFSGNTKLIAVSVLSALFIFLVVVIVANSLKKK